VLALIISIFQPNIILQILKLSNDIESNPGPMIGNLNILFSNINSLTADEGNRFEDLKLRLLSEKVHIAAISETGSNLNLDKYNIDHYHSLDPTFYRPQGRGMLLTVKRRPDLEDQDTECMWIETMVKHKKMLLGSYYRSPSQSPAVRDQFITSFDRSVGRVLGNRAGIIIEVHLNLLLLEISLLPPLTEVLAGCWEIGPEM
jgi:hypothetical protein